MTWDGSLFHSYMTNIRFNLIVDQGRAGETPIYQFLWWFLLASVGLGALCVVVALRDVLPPLMYVVNAVGFAVFGVNEIGARWWLSQWWQCFHFSTITQVA